LGKCNGGDMNAVDDLNDRLNNLVCFQNVKFEDIYLITMDKNSNDILMSLVSDTNLYGKMISVDPTGKYIVVFRGISVKINPAMKKNSIQIDYMEGTFNASVLLTGITYGD
jgi:hypothetical protein